MDDPFFFDPNRLDELAASLAEPFGAAAPFPHVSIDDFIGPEVVDRVLDEFPKPDELDWQRFADAREKKLASNQYEMQGPYTRQVLAQFNGPTFIRFLERMTRMEGLIPDPWYVGGGLHQIETGGFLKVHADFNKHEKLRLDRRLNALLYLNRDWDESWGGHLELWDEGMEQCVERIAPLAGRLVVFATTSTSYHGHPDPLRCPPDRQRRSMALYYYTNGRPEEGDPDSSSRRHTTLFRQRPGERTAARDAVAQWVPPAVLDASRRARRRVRKG